MIFKAIQVRILILIVPTTHSCTVILSFFIQFITFHVQFEYEKITSISRGLHWCSKDAGILCDFLFVMSIPQM